jgi:hypothetical protein
VTEPPAPLREDVRRVAADQVLVLGDVVAAMTDAELVAPTRCHGWLVAHALVHMRLGLTEQATAFVDPAFDEIDRDYVSYWGDWKPAEAPVTFADVRFHWATAAAYGSADMLRAHFADTVTVAAAASRNAPSGRFKFQGHVMTAADILAMWTTEWVVHQLDITTRVPPLPAAIALAVQTVDGLTGPGFRLSSWTDTTYVEKATGRQPLEDHERRVLGSRATAFPVFG